MQFVRQDVSFPITEVKFGEQDENNKRHSSLLPNNVRAIICGPSGCGKTNLLIRLLVNEHGLKFSNLFICGKSLHQPKYEYLRSIMKKVPEITYKEYNSTEDLLPAAEIPVNSTMIFDDVGSEKQKNIREYYSMGRHRFTDSLYLCQTYAAIPKHLIRDNANIIILFKQDEKNLRHIYSNHVSPDMTWEQFHTLCGTIWQHNHNFLTIDKESGINGGRYRRNLDEYLKITT